MQVSEATVVVRNKMGLHARPSTQIATAASRYVCEIKVSKDGLSVDGKSVLELLMLAAECGSTLTITAQGEDAEAAVQELSGLIETRFGEHEVDTV